MRRDVRFTPEADMCSALGDVRFVPTADIHGMTTRNRKTASRRSLPLVVKGLFQADQAARLNASCAA
jgi:hypothetical protein